jgi:hypothetical protein
MPEIHPKFTPIMSRLQIDTGQVAGNFTIDAARDIITGVLNIFIRR